MDGFYSSEDCLILKLWDSFEKSLAFVLSSVFVCFHCGITVNTCEFVIDVNNPFPSTRPVNRISV